MKRKIIGAATAAGVGALLWVNPLSAADGQSPHSGPGAHPHHKIDGQGWCHDIQAPPMTGGGVHRAALADDQKPMTASDELSVLLGMTSPKEVETRQGRKSAEQTERIGKKSDTDEGNTDAAGTKVDAHAADPMLIMIDTKHRGSDDAAADDSSSSARGDVVRLVSANGRGRSVDARA